MLSPLGSSNITHFVHFVSHENATCVTFVNSIVVCCTENQFTCSAMATCDVIPFTVNPASADWESHLVRSITSSTSSDLNSCSLVEHPNLQVMSPTLSATFMGGACATCAKGQSDHNGSVAFCVEDAFSFLPYNEVKFEGDVFRRGVPVFAVFWPAVLLIKFLKGAFAKMGKQNASRSKPSGKTSVKVGCKPRGREQLRGQASRTDSAGTKVCEGAAAPSLECGGCKQEVRIVLSPLEAQTCTAVLRFGHLISFPGKLRAVRCSNNSSLL